MLLREVDQGGDFISSLEAALDLYLDQANAKGLTATIDYATLGRLMTRFGLVGKINQHIIDSAIAKSEALQTLIANHDGEGITLNTDSEPPKDEVDQPDLEKTDQGISKTTQQAASRAAEKTLAQ